MTEHIGPLYSPTQVARMLDPEGQIGITTSSVKSEIRSGRLKAIKFAGKLCIRESDLRERLSCQDAAEDHSLSRSGPPPTRNGSGTSSGEKTDASAAVAQASHAAKKLRKTSSPSSLSDDTSGPSAPVVIPADKLAYVPPVALSF